MASTAFLQMTRKRPWVSLGAAAAGVTTASAFALEAHADRQERRVVASLHGNNNKKTASQVEDALASAGRGIGLPRTYDRQQIRDYWLQRPVSVAKRVGEIAMELGPVGAQYYLQEKFLASNRATTNDGIDSLEQTDGGRLLEEQQARLQNHAKELREALTNLGPAWVKGACSFFRSFFRWSLPMIAV